MPLVRAVEDEPAVLAAVKRDLERHYGERCRAARSRPPGPRRAMSLLSCVPQHARARAVMP
jgi:hypothetical protein